MKKKWIKLLYRSFDEPLTAKEQQRLHDALISDEQLKEEKEQISRFRTTVQQANPEGSFSPFFADRVVNRTLASKSAEEPVFEALLSLFRPIAVAALIILLILISFNLKNTGDYSVAGALGEQPATLEEIVDPMYTWTME